MIAGVEKDSQEVSVLLLCALFLNVSGGFTGVRLWFVNTVYIS